MIIFYCKRCDKELKAHLHNAGKMAVCLYCLNKNRVPELPVLLDDEVETVEVKKAS